VAVGLFLATLDALVSLGAEFPPPEPGGQSLIYCYTIGSPTLRIGRAPEFGPKSLESLEREFCTVR